MTANLRLRMLPRYPANITATNGFEVERDGVDLVFKPDYGQLGVVASVPDMNETFFQSWTRDIDAYNIIPFQALVDNIGDVIIGPNLSAIGGLTTGADTGIYYTGAGTAATYTLTQFTRDFSASVDAEAAGVALGLGSAAYSENGDFATAAQGLIAESALQPGDETNPLDGSVTEDKLADGSVTPVKLVDGIMPFATRDSAVAADIDPSIHSVSLKGDVTEGDGLGGLFIDTNNGNPNTFVSADGRTWYRVVSSNPKLFEFGAKGDGVTLDDVAVAAAVAAGKVVDGQGKVYSLSSMPNNFLNFRNAGFLVAGEVYPTKDFTRAELKYITDTDFMAGWCQEMACTYKNWIIVPFKYGFRDEFFTSRYAFTISFDGGDKFSEPEIFLDYHPNSPTYGYNTFAAGVKHNRFLVGVEERLTSDRSLTAIYLYDRLLPFSYRMENNGIALVSGSPIAKITLANHGLMVGDAVYLSGVAGTGVTGLSGKLIVASVINNNTFTVNKGTNSIVTAADTGGTAWNIASAWADNAWRITSIPMFQNVNGVPLTGLHSLEDNPNDPNKFWIGYNNGISPREVGAIIVDNWYSTPTFSTTKIQQDLADNAAEPSLRFNPDDGYLYLTTRGASTTVGGSSFNFMSPGGVWQGYKLPGLIHNGPVPFEIDGDKVFLFGTERAENEWEADTPLNRWNVNRPRTFMLTVPLAEARVGNFDNYRETLLGYGIFNGEQNASGNGVGSSLKTETDIWYFFGSQDFRLMNRYSTQTSPTKPSEVLPFKGHGIPEEIWAYRIPIKSRAGLNSGKFIGTPARNFGMSRFNNRILMEGPLDFSNAVRFAGRLCLAQSAVYYIVDGVVTITDENCSSITIDTEASASTDLLQTIAFLVPPKNGTEFLFQAASSGRDITYVHNTGNLKLEGSTNVTLPNAQSTLRFQYVNGEMRQTGKTII